MSWRAQLSKYLKEIRVHLCQNSPSSDGVREFVKRNYADLKMLNPKLPILIRECSGIEPKLYTRYAFGVEQSVSLSGLTEQQVISKLEELYKAQPKA